MSSAIRSTNLFCFGTAKHRKVWHSKLLKLDLLTILSTTTCTFMTSFIICMLYIDVISYRFSIKLYSVAQLADLRNRLWVDIFGALFTGPRCIYFIKISYMYFARTTCLQNIVWWGNQNHFWVKWTHAPTIVIIRCRSSCACAAWKNCMINNLLFGTLSKLLWMCF